jgi:hypothetical protein
MEKKEEVRRRKKNPIYFTNHMNSEGGESYPQLFYHTSNVFMFSLVLSFILAFFMCYIIADQVTKVGD